MFYDRFMNLCKAQGKSPAAVAREIGLSNSSTTTWKRGAIPKGETLQKLADYFGVSVDYLLVDTWGIKAGGKIKAGGGIKSRYGIEAGGGIETGGPVEVGPGVYGESDDRNQLLSHDDITMALMHEASHMIGADKKALLAIARSLNASRRSEAEERPETAPESTPAPQERSTTPPPDAPETPPEGE